ncbi:uncharacterized protein LOC134529231 isoform X1 [Bacillus rossius redtenbacheri]|uniref:uncharacterized protein LOC134529231 isoform X1 n=1 Tax=Bacillus rossius redtenbacheri TaxID=93214 RepID=UPI002FDED901
MKGSNGNPRQHFHSSRQQKSIPEADESAYVPYDGGEVQSPQHAVNPEHRLLKVYFLAPILCRLCNDYIWGTGPVGVKCEPADCKDRWKNIRGRYVKCKNQKNLPSGNGVKQIKDYYLTPHLHFLDTFRKSCESKGNIMVSETSHSIEDTDNSVHQEEDFDNENSEDGSLQHGSSASETVEHRPPSSIPNQPLRANHHMTPGESYRKRKAARTLSDLKKRACKYFETKEKLMMERQTSQLIEPIDPEMAFLHSLLPDMKAMGEAQKRKFKIRVIQLTD